MASTSDRTVVTTGANSGIGLATVLEVARRGLRSVGTVRSEAKAEVVAKAAADAGVDVETALLDVADADGCAEVIERYRPFGLVNNAGFSNTGAVEDVSDEDARAQLEAMVIAPMRLARLSLPTMREAGAGRIVQVSSIFGLITSPLTGWYAASKHALEAVSDALRMEVASAGIRIILVEPGGIRTGIWEENRSDVERRAGSRFDAAYQRTLASTRVMEPVMLQPPQCARVIGHALTTVRPRARYLVGLDAQAASVSNRLTPTFVKDTVSRLGLGL